MQTLQRCSRAACSRRTAVVVAAAAKKGKKPAQKKGGSALADLMAKKQAAEAAPAGGAGDALPLGTRDQWGNPDVVLQLMSICQGYKKSYDEFLMEVGFDQLAEAMWKAPFVCLAHNKFEEGVADPLFTYANKAALELFEGTWDTLVGVPSRLSVDQADAAALQDRSAAIEQAADGGGITTYEGWRVSLGGRRFKIRNVRLFNVAELDGTLWGQAAVFNQYELEDGTLVTVQGEEVGPSSIEVPPSLEEVQAAEAAVQEQAGAVRALKEQQGLANSDPAVQAAVAELQARKAALAGVQQRYEAALQEAEAAAAAPPTVSLDEE